MSHPLLHPSLTNLPARCYALRDLRKELGSTDSFSSLVVKARRRKLSYSLRSSTARMRLYRSSEACTAKRALKRTEMDMLRKDG